MSGAKTKGGNKGPEIATTEKIKARSINEVEYCIEPGAELEHITMACYQFAQKEHSTPDVGDPPREMGCVATSDPMFEMPHEIEDLVIASPSWLYCGAKTRCSTENGTCATSLCQSIITTSTTL